ncbi:MAG: B12-binding domain-containing radical SAM protein [Proteobacteria bacterium]|nr:B12-binding domain-containing radical SAM protein [Pseudomonadota bacterium]MBU1741013.1 B12-binding domain-containing radical SAM protein [Pseudomonadota bacterium]
MDILFVSDIKNFAIGGFEPLGLEYLSAGLKRAGHRTHITDLDLDDAVATIRRHDVGLVGYSVTTGLQRAYLDFNRRLKGRVKVVSVFGGPHPTFVPRIIDQPGVDLICIGEGERAAVELADRIEAGRDYGDIENLFVKRDGRVIHNPVRPGERSLDEFPHPDRDLVYAKFPDLARTTMKTVLAGRGCLFKCSYCYHQEFMDKHGLKNVVRMRDVDDLMAELMDLKAAYPVEFFRFVDASVGFKKSWLREFSGKYRDRIGVPFSCGLNPYQGSEEVIRLLAAAGCASVNWAVETGDQRLRYEVLNRRVPDRVIFDMAARLKQYGLKSWLQNMVGLPGGSLAHDLKTLDMNIALEPDYAWVSIFTPYPGTPINQTMRTLGLFDGDPAAFDKTYYHTSVLDIPDKRQVTNLSRLFALVVEFPFLRRYVPGLIKLPLGPAYEVARKLFKGWCMVRRILPSRPRPVQFVRNAWRVMFGSAG